MLRSLPCYLLVARINVWINTCSWKYCVRFKHVSLLKVPGCCTKVSFSTPICVLCLFRAYGMIYQAKHTWGTKMGNGTLMTQGNAIRYISYHITSRCVCVRKLYSGFQILSSPFDISQINRNATDRIGEKLSRIASLRCKSGGLLQYSVVNLISGTCWWMFASVQINIPYLPDTVSSWEMDVNDIGIGSNGYHSLRD